MTPRQGRCSGHLRLVTVRTNGPGNLARRRNPFVIQSVIGPKLVLRTIFITTVQGRARGAPNRCAANENRILVMNANDQPLLMPSQLFARDASNLFKSSDAGGELDLREKAKHYVGYSVEEASTALPVVPAGRVENHSKVFS